MTRRKPTKVRVAIMVLIVVATGVMVTAVYRASRPPAHPRCAGAS